LRPAEDVAALVERMFAHAPVLRWYADRARLASPDPAMAAAHFVRRSQSEDVSPVPLFDPIWFRTHYRVSGPNAFVSYVASPLQFFAWPSPLFYPRWYWRRNHLGPDDPRPFFHFLLEGGKAEIHPLLDRSFISAQAGGPPAGFVVWEYLDDPKHFPVQPHPLFHSAWYHETNPDVAAARVNPVLHYLYSGHREGRNPNPIFSVNWYRERHLRRKGRRAIEFDPLTHYVTSGYLARLSVAPHVTIIDDRMTGIRPVGRRMRIATDRAETFAAVERHLSPLSFRSYLPRDVDAYNPLLPPRTLLLPRQGIAIMYSAKCASAAIVFWWLAQAGLLDTARRFTWWSHDFEQIFRSSTESIVNGLCFRPEEYAVYKFVRNPVSRATSAFAQYLLHPATYAPRSYGGRMSFNQFLDMLSTRNFLDNDVHFIPQVTLPETRGAVNPRALKIELGLDSQLRDIERTHGLARFDLNEDPAARFAEHYRSRRQLPPAHAGPDDPLPFGTRPVAKGLLSEETLRKIASLYAADFAAYGYEPPRIGGDPAATA
jgi:hypothetical protein